jgi:hypothetical protein
MDVRSEMRAGNRRNVLLEVVYRKIRREAGERHDRLEAALFTVITGNWDYGFTGTMEGSVFV